MACKIHWEYSSLGLTRRTYRNVGRICVSDWSKIYDATLGKPLTILCRRGFAQELEIGINGLRWSLLILLYTLNVHPLYSHFSTIWSNNHKYCQIDSLFKILYIDRRKRVFWSLDLATAFSLDSSIDSSTRTVTFWITWSMARCSRLLQEYAVRIRLFLRCIFLPNILPKGAALIFCHKKPYLI